MCAANHQVLSEATLLSTCRTVCHSSDSVENAEKEIELWVPSFFLSCFAYIPFSCSWFPERVVRYEATFASWIFE